MCVSVSGLLLAVYRPACDSRQRIVGDSHGHVQLFAQKLVKTAQECPSSSQNQAIVDEVGDKFGIALFDAAFEARQD